MPERPGIVKLASFASAVQVFPMETHGRISENRR
jgi:hypothetical protein